MRQRFYRFMQGRYGADQLGRALSYVALALVILNVFVRSRILELAVWVLLILCFYRTFSKNHAARYGENQKYLQLSARYRYWFEQQKKLAQERKYHRIYTCPKCKQKIRIPKGKGKIMVRCPKCRHEFQKRS